MCLEIGSGQHQTVPSRANLKTGVTTNRVEMETAFNTGVNQMAYGMTRTVTIDIGTFANSLIMAISSLSIKIQINTKVTLEQKNEIKLFFIDKFVNYLEYNSQQKVFNTT